MENVILRDKLLGPILIILVIGTFCFIKMSGSVFIAVFLSISFVILLSISICRTDRYIHNYIHEDEVFTIEYQKNFSKNKMNTFSINSDSIRSFKFYSKTFLDPFHRVSINYFDDEDYIDEKIFKINNDDKFINLIYELKKEKNKYLNSNL
ncbi:hypothetical protein [Winogradskyella schleiferi]|uniref:hypothetical protein n=1 Tax=Winogradskyella schleiferi TaxID=2686078 RepID=UPI0015BB09A8|nr:hypothetical protein [Winogradskyella schleiferi]